MIGITVPNFVVAPVLSLVIGVYLGWLPAGGWGEGAWRQQGAADRDPGSCRSLP